MTVEEAAKPPPPTSSSTLAAAADAQQAAKREGEADRGDSAESRHLEEERGDENTDVNQVPKEPLSNQVTSSRTSFSDFLKSNPVAAQQILNQLAEITSESRFPT